MKKILFFGDSITDCGRNRDNDDSLGQGYPLLIKSELGFENPERYTFLNRGISGNRIVDLYARIKKDLINLAPDYVSILIGVNDVWHEIGRRTEFLPKNMNYSMI
ncbi:MAG: GDSL-type esterase/lipase family protein [Clostridia bacterium]|nr:GDSL-type esterase/lipase family protein [Clostridia bacterium]